jgi:arginine decarboxylase
MTEASHDYYNLQNLDPANVALYNVGRLRTDIWHFLRDSARRLRRIHDDPRFADDKMWLITACGEVFDFLRPLEDYFAFPGITALEQLRSSFDRGLFDDLARQALRLVRMMNNESYRRLDLATSQLKDYADLLNVAKLNEEVHARLRQERRLYFEALVVDDLSRAEAKELRAQARNLRRPEDEFLYEAVVATTFEDALIAILLNPNIQSVLIRYSFPYRTGKRLKLLDEIYTILGIEPKNLESLSSTERSLHLGSLLKALRPELDIFMVTDAPVEDVVGGPSRDFRRIFYLQENYREVHLSVLKGIHERFETPFFNALRRHSQKPTGMFHALPISHSATINKSHWIRDLARFYGHHIFEAETSATTGGLDSLLQPHGSLREAQELSARAFGSRRTYFVTNGTSTANKIVMQALIRPADIVLLAHDCHKSHPYAVILAGAYPVYLDAYPLSEYSMYGGVPFVEIKRRLLELKRAGKLDQVRMLLLTNITFDGIAYDPVRVMEEVLAIKPDMIFLWDEAWCAYARFAPVLRRRTAMWSAAYLRKRFASAAYRREYEQWRADFESRTGLQARPANSQNGGDSAREDGPGVPSYDEDNDDVWLNERLKPDPDKARVRVYATQSTHKTLTALRQGSMIHVHDQDFEHHARNAFNEAYMTHTSTSPNYQILATLDVGRRQVELEGYDFVAKSITLAMMLRERITADSQLARYFRVLAPEDMIPAEHRPSGIEFYYDPDRGWGRMDLAAQLDEFVLDPTRITLHVGRTGMDGDSFKQLLMNKYDIQINKTSRNTVLFMIHIGMSRGTIAHLVNVLTQIARDLDDKLDRWSRVELDLFEKQVRAFTEELPPLPNFSCFHPTFRPTPDSTTPEGDMRRAFFLAYDETQCEYLKLDDGSLLAAVDSKREVVSAAFITPYPPGFPVLAPGQVITREIVEFLLALDVKEIHGYEPAFGLRVFTPAAVAAEEGRLNGTGRTGLQARPSSEVRLTQ